jgi:hypothetical protein
MKQKHIFKANTTSLFISFGRTGKNVQRMRENVNFRNIKPKVHCNPLTAHYCP